MTARWRLLRHQGVGAAEGLALDEALAAGYDREQQPPHDATLRLYTYQDTAALVGRFQSLEAELDLAACAARGVAVNRRPTGGGAIIMGGGQLGVALATRAPATLRGRELLGSFADGIVAGLAELGIGAEFHGKNDVTVARRKIAGLGLYVRDGGGLLLHASVLADLDIELMLSLLRIPAAKLSPVSHLSAGLPASRAAVEERITTVSRLLDSSHDGGTIAAAIGAGLARHFDARLLGEEATSGEADAAAQLRLQRYDDPGWLTEVAPAPDTTGSCELRTRAGLLRFYATAHNDVLKSLLIATDASVLPPGLVELESALRWRRLDPAALASTVAAQTALVAGLTPAGEDPALVVDSIVTAVLTAARPRSAPAADRAAAQPVRPAGSCYFPDLHDAR